MAIVNTNLTSGGNGSGFSNSDNTASIAPSANQLVLAWVGHDVTSGTPNTPTLTGCSLTWVLVATAVSGITRVSLFRALGAAPTTGAVTIDFGGQTQNEEHWSISQFAGVNTGGTNGSGAVVQSATNVDAGGGLSLTVTLSAFGSAANGTAGGFYVNSPETYTPGSGFTQIAVDQGESGASQSLFTEWRADNDTTVDASWTNSQVSLGIAVEIAAAALPDEDFWNVPIVQPQEFLVSIW